MSNLSVLEFKTDESVKMVLEEAMKRVDNFSEIMVVSNNKDGTQFLVCSNSTAAEKAWMVSLAQAWMTKLVQMEAER